MKTEPFRCALCSTLFPTDYNGVEAPPYVFSKDGFVCFSCCALKTPHVNASESLPALTLELLDLIQSDRPAALTDNPANVPRIVELLRDVRALAQRECAFERVNDNQGKSQIIEL